MGLTNKIELAEQEIIAYEISSISQKEAFRLKYLSRKGLVPDLFELFKETTQEEKKLVGKRLNDLKKLAESKLLALEYVERPSTSTNTTEDYTKLMYLGTL